MSIIKTNRILLGKAIAANLKKQTKHVNTLSRQNAQLVKDFVQYTGCPVTSCRNLRIISLI